MVGDWTVDTVDRVPQTGQINLGRQDKLTQEGDKIINEGDKTPNVRLTEPRSLHTLFS